MKDEAVKELVKLLRDAAQVAGDQVPDAVAQLASAEALSCAIWAVAWLVVLAFMVVGMLLLWLRLDEWDMMELPMACVGIVLLVAFLCSVHFGVSAFTIVKYPKAYVIKMVIK